MLRSTMHRRWAREYLDGAERATTRRRKLDYLRLAVCNSVRAQALEASEERKNFSKARRKLQGSQKVRQAQKP